ncbi:MAG: hypothetical protein JW904_10880 [Spirochaetales bacterium]|nr:hypothetical protein [Spirochaetales bacterium]
MSFLLIQINIKIYKILETPFFVNQIEPAFHFFNRSSVLCCVYLLSLHHFIYYLFLMSDVQSLIQKNTMLKRLIAEGNLSPENLKKLYRHLSKLSHPDIKKEDSAEFIQLTDEYEEAMSNLERIKSYLMQRGPAGDVLDAEDIQRMFFSSLRHYLAAGMNSQRMRIRADVRKRNDLILREIVYWAKLYDPAFIPVFLNYNKTYLRRFTEWKKRDEIMRAKKLFYFGFHDTIKYEENRSRRALAAAQTNLKECLEILAMHSSNPFAKAMQDCAAWFLIRLDLLAGKKAAVPKKAQAGGTESDAAGDSVQSKKEADNHE